MPNKVESHKSIKVKVKPSGKERKPQAKLKRTYSTTFGQEESNIKVIIRVRPFIGRELQLKDKFCANFVSNESISITENEKNKKQFTFDRVLTDKSTQEECFKYGPKSIVKQSMNGFNGCIFVYGQTGSGKTYSMYGDDNNYGIVYNAINLMYEIMEENKVDKEYKISLSFLEIYNEELTDLLINQKENKENKSHEKKLKIRQDKDGHVHVEGLTANEITTKEDIKKYIDFGIEQRVVGYTDMNAQSSRSHSVLGIHIFQQDKEDISGFSVQNSTLYLIDLAGSERAGHSNTANTELSNKRLKEGANINKSLTSLGMVIKALVDGQSFIPYRNSQLTRLLQNSLGGNSMTCIICNMSPALSNFNESLSTLQFANRAKNIKNKATKFKDPKIARIMELEIMNQKLEQQLLECQEENDRLQDIIANNKSNNGNVPCEQSKQCCLIM